MRILPIHLKFIFTSLCFVLAGPAAADEAPLTYDRIDFAVQATREVENDTLIAVLYSQREGEDVGKLADEVNRAIQWGIAEAGTSPGVKAQTLEYYTSPVYRNQKLLGWRVNQSLRLESGDSARLGQLIGKLQKRLAVRSIRYDVSPARRGQVEDEMIGEAIRRFGRRAKLITSRLDRSAYRLVKMNVNTSGSAPLPRQGRIMAMQAESSVSPPALEAGTQMLRVNVSGTIELKLN